MRSQELCEMPRPVRLLGQGTIFYSQTQHSGQHNIAFNQGVRVPKNGQNPPYESFLESRGFRPEIQGLRAFAVLLVVVYHVWVGKVSGGVDVFLFISTFLLSLSFMRKINEGKPLNLLNYWTHVFTRLLPAASVVILLTLAGSLLVLSPTAWSARAVDAQASPGEQDGGGVPRDGVALGLCMNQPRPHPTSPSTSSSPGQVKP